MYICLATVALHYMRCQSTRCQAIHSQCMCSFSPVLYLYHTQSRTDIYKADKRSAHLPNIFFDLLLITPPYLFQRTLGVGLPDAEHSKRASEPAGTVRLVWPVCSEGATGILGASGQKNIQYVNLCINM